MNLSYLVTNNTLGNSQPNTFWQYCTVSILDVLYTCQVKLHQNYWFTRYSLFTSPATPQPTGYHRWHRSTECSIYHNVYYSIRSNTGVLNFITVRRSLERGKYVEVVEGDGRQFLYSILFLFYWVYFPETS